MLLLVTCNVKLDSLSWADLSERIILIKSIKSSSAWLIRILAFFIFPQFADVHFHQADSNLLPCLCGIFLVTIHYHTSKPGVLGLMLLWRPLCLLSDPVLQNPFLPQNSQSKLSFHPGSCFLSQWASLPLGNLRSLEGSWPQYMGNGAYLQCIGGCSYLLLVRYVKLAKQGWCIM